MSKTQKIITEVVTDIKENIKNGNLENSDDIRQFIYDSNLFFAEDTIALYKENEECGLSEISASSMVVGEYVSFGELVTDIIGDLLTEAIIETLKKDNMFYLEDNE